jgi:RHS repeat-associated protein
MFTKNNNDANLEGYTDYYPGGMAMPNRQMTDANGYRYGYQGQYAEEDKETGLNAFQLRMYDTRINRWLSPDPYGQYHSPYMSMGNNWISFTDSDGGKADDWYRKLDKNGNPTEEYVWFDGSDQIEGYEHKGLSFYDADTGAFGFSDGSFKNFRTGEFYKINFLDEVVVGPGANLSFNEQLANTVEPLIGSPYVWGANGPDCFDCSGTLIYAIRQVLNPNFTDTNADGLFRNYSVSTDGGRGTLVFYDYTSDGVIDHVTTIMNDTHMLHPSQGNGVLERRELDYLDNYTDRRGGTSYRRELDWNRINN